MDELDPSSRALIDAAMPAAWPSEDVEERVLARVREAIAGPPGGGGEDAAGDGGDAGGEGARADGGVEMSPWTGPSSPVAPPPALGVWGALQVAGITLAVVVGTALLAGPTGPPAPAPAPARTVPTPAESPSPATSSPAERPAVAAEEEVPAPVSADAPAPAPARRASRASATPGLDDSLTAETALIAAANAALARGDAAEVLRLVARHAERFPKGQLGDEADALRVMALCVAADARADAAVARFRRERAGSSHLGRVREVCDGPRPSR